MPCRITIDVEAGCIDTHFSGRITAATLHDYYRDMRTHPDFDPAMLEIVDLSAVTAIDVTAHELRGFSMVTSSDTVRGADVRVAIVAPTDLAYGLARMYALLQDRSVDSLRVVRTRDEAIAWRENERRRLPAAADAVRRD